MMTLNGSVNGINFFFDLSMQKQQNNSINVAFYMGPRYAKPYLLGFSNSLLNYRD